MSAGSIHRQNKGFVAHLAVRDFVDSEPLVGSSDEAGQMTLYILDVVELAS